MNILTLGFRFHGESSSLHCYTQTDGRTEPAETLREMASMIVSTVDDNLRSYAITIPVHQ